MPVRRIRWYDNDVAGLHLLDSFAFTLHPAASVGDIKRLTERVGVPSRASARLEAHYAPPEAGGLGGRKALANLSYSREIILTARRGFCIRAGHNRNVG